jgi:hypothetical protein
MMDNIFESKLFMKKMCMFKNVMWLGTMNNLYVFYGENITGDGPEGLDLSRCESKNVSVEGLANTSFMDVRRRIRAEFGPEMARKKIIVEAVVCKKVGEGYRWALRQVKGDNSWGSYMKFASTPGAAMYEQPMVYVQFVDASDEPGSSTAAGELQLSIAAMAINTEEMDVSHVLVPSQNTGEEMDVHHRISSALSDIQGVV